MAYPTIYCKMALEICNSVDLKRRCSHALRFLRHLRTREEGPNTNKREFICPLYYRVAATRFRFALTVYPTEYVYAADD